MNKDAKIIADLLKVLANEYRLMILCVLLEGPETVNEIGAKISAISQSAISQHLSILKAHGILSSEKSGQNVIYSIEDKRVKEVIDVLKVYYCKKNQK